MQIKPDNEVQLIAGGLILAGVLLALDQITKIAVIEHFGEPGLDSIEIIPGFFNIVYVLNDGAAWNILSGKYWVLIIFTIAILLIMFYSFRSLAEGWRERYYALFMIASGALGNAADRIWNNGKVVDFLDFDLGFYRWPSFNVADSSICVGVVIILLSYWLRPKREEIKTEQTAS